ncbi:MAG: RNA methyltransferase [Verrucomicrobiota bacterium]|nr:RNA methyltransferase [Verrucomicrobiota bacterium]
MVSKEILSLQHPFVKEWVALRLEKKARDEAGQVLLMGEKMIRELAKKVSLEAIITVAPAPDIHAKEHYLVSEAVLKKITGLPAPDGFAAIAPLPKPQKMEGKQRLLILDRIADPGNLGTLLRTALALGWDGVFFTPGTVDPFNDKALRASKGALFSLPFSYGKPLIEGYTPYLADTEGTPLSKVKASLPLALILSNEGEGPAPWAEKYAHKIAIPMHNGVESLSVATSGAILLYELRITG